MNEHDSFTANAPNYRYGFLAGALQEVLSRPIDTALGEEEIRQLELGRAFLQDLIAGVTLVSGGETRTVSPTRAVGALDYALGPLQSMENLRNEEGALSFLDAVLRAVNASLVARRIAGDPAVLRQAEIFFGHLYDDILATLNRRQREARSPGSQAALM